MGLLANKETNSKGALLWTVLIVVGLYVVFAIFSNYLLSDTTNRYGYQLYRPDFPFKKLMNISNYMRVAILVSFIGIIYNIRESIILLWIGYVILIITSLILALGMNMNDSVEVYGKKGKVSSLSYLLPLSYIIVPLIITILLKPIKENFRRIIPKP